MFDALSERLGSIFDGLTGRGALSDKDVHEALRELRAQEITFLLLTLDDPVTRSLYERTPFLRHLIREVQPFARVHGASAFDLTTVNFEP